MVLRNRLLRVRRGAFANIAGSTVTTAWKGDAENALVAGLDFSDQFTNNIALFERVNGQFSIYKRAFEDVLPAHFRYQYSA